MPEVWARVPFQYSCLLLRLPTADPVLNVNNRLKGSLPMSDTRTTDHRTRTPQAPRRRRQHHRTTRHAVRRILHCQGELPGGIYRMREAQTS